MRFTFLLGALALAVATTFTASNSLALPGENNCAKYAPSATVDARFTEAIKAVAAYLNYTFDELCTQPRIWDIEAQPSRVITRQGDVIPHVVVQLHREFDSCLYKVRDADKVITSASCYSGE